MTEYLKESRGLFEFFPSSRLEKSQPHCARLFEAKESHIMQATLL
jgi:hypothetical protein